MDQDERWIEEVKEKCESAFKGLLWQPKLPDDTKDPNIRKSRRSEQLSQPRAVTIGPFLRDKSTHITDEEKYLIVYLMNHLFNLDLQDRLMKIKNQVPNARSWYSDSDIPESFGSTDDSRFAEMLLLDSYFILFMLTFISEIHSEVTCEGVNLYRSSYSSKSLKIMQLGKQLFRGADSSKKQKIMLAVHVVPRFAGILRYKDLITVDLLILRNQIPFFVIEELFENLKLTKPLYKYALEFFKKIHPNSARSCICQKRSPEFLHLLHLFHWSRVPTNKRNTVLGSWRPQLDDVSWELHIPTATELRKSATVFAKKTSLGSSLDITFSRSRLLPIVWALNIPRLHIHEYSSRIFHNLIAFEMQRPISDRRTMAFLAIVENLLQSEQDAKLLRQYGILAKTCMTDYEIVNCFKSLSRLTDKDNMPIDAYVFCRQVLSYHKRRRMS